MKESLNPNAPLLAIANDDPCAVSPSNSWFDASKARRLSPMAWEFHRRSSGRVDPSGLEPKVVEKRVTESGKRHVKEVKGDAPRWKS